MMKTKLMLLSVALCLTTALSAQGLYLEAPKIVAEGEQFQVVFSAEGSKVEDFKWAPGQDVNLVWGPVQGTQKSFSLVNGKRSSSVTYSYSYILEATKEGKITISSATATIDGKPYSTSPVTVEVISSSSSQGSSSQQSQSQQSQGQQSGSASVSGGDVFMTLDLTKKNVMVGEPIIVTLKLYTNTDLSNLESPQFPTFNGFWSQEIDSPSNLNFERANVGGRLYQSALLRRYMIIPQQSGKITIDPAEMVAVVIVRSSPRSGASIFDSFFDNYQTVRKRIRTDAVTVNVSDLPSGAPASFKGGVGKFSIDASVSSDTLKMHEAATLKVSVNGTGNISLAEAPDVTFPSDFEAYDMKVSETQGTSKSMSGTKIFEYPFIPRSSGVYDIPAVEYSYYDTSSDRYVTLRTEPMRVTVLPGDENDAPSVFNPGAGRKTVKNLNEDIRFIATGDPELRRSGSFFVLSPLFFGLAAFIVIVFAVSVLALRKYIIRSSDVRYVRNKKATKMAMKRLSAAQDYMKRNLYSPFYEELHKALLGYISDKLSMPAVDMSKENISAELQARGVSEEMRDACLGLIDACEFARYSPDAGNEAMQNHYKEAVKVISTIDGMIKGKKSNAARTLAVSVLMVAGAAFSSEASAAEQFDQVWSEANALYSEGKWNEAIDRYMSIKDMGYESDKLYYNMGNAFFKSGNISGAVINYERALKINPSFKDARNNLDMVSSLTVDRIEEVPEFILKSWVVDLMHVMGSDSWAIFSIVFLALAAILFFLYIFTGRRGAKLTFFIAGLAALLVFAVSLSFSLAIRGESLAEDEAVVTAAVSSVRSSPSEENTKSLFILHEGTKVEILENLGDWLKVEIADGRQGWINGKDIEVI